MSVLLYPHQLFNLKDIPKDWKNYQFYLLEEPVFWGTDKKLKLNMNQLKLVLHRASMKYYESILKNKGYKVKYLEEKDLNKNGYSFLKKDNSTTIYLFDPVDHLVFDKIDKAGSKYNKDVEVFETPNFLLSEEQIDKYLKEKSKKNHYFHKNFYDWVKKELDLVKDIGSKSYDKENRKPLPDNIKLPGIPKGDQNSKWVKEAIKYIEKNYGNNYGQANNFYLPITHKSSEEWFKVFLKNKFSKFGDYQDAITPDDPWVFHSVISPMLNVGLLDPRWIIDNVIEYYKKNKSVGKNNLEGFVRQIIGWREYSRMLYIRAYDEVKGNYFNHKNKLSKEWYDGTLGIEPVDWSIKTAFDKGYLHHILRLMVMANFMNLCEINPDEVFKWFMEFSMDSYQWVMHNNIYGMGTYADGGLTMRKPYLSSANYIEKMSKFKPDGKWEQIWTDLFYRFLVKHEKKLKGTPYVRNLAHYKKKNKNEQSELMNRANKFIRDYTK